MTHSLRTGQLFAMAIAVLMIIPSCTRGTEGGGDVSTLVVRDSAGIEIVEVPLAALEALPTWRIGVEPLISIGQLEGEAEYLFTEINASTGVAALDDGSVAIVDGSGLGAGARQIRLFDPGGRFVRSIGRAGEGPGEFGSPPDIQQHADGGIVALEPLTRRVTIFDPSGGFVESWQSASPDACPRSACMAISGVVANGHVPLSFPERPPASVSTIGQTFDQLHVTFGLESRDGFQELMTVRSPPMRVFQGRLLNGREVPVAATTMSEVAQPVITGGREHVVVAQPENHELSVFDATGQLLRIIRLKWTPAPFTTEEQRALQAADEAVTVPAKIEGRPAALHRPSFGQITTGSDDDLWLWGYRHPAITSSTEPERVLILGIDGRPIAHLEVRPDPIFADQVRAASHRAVSSRDHLRIVTQDALGVNRLLVFPIDK